MTTPLGTRNPGAAGYTYTGITVDGHDVIQAVADDQPMGLTSLQYSFERRDLDDGGERLVVTGLDHEFDIESPIYLPDWRPAYGQASRECLRAYCEWIGDVIDHELHHARDHTAVAAQSEAIVADRLAETPPSVRIPPEADDAVRERKHRELNARVEELIRDVVVEMSQRTTRRSEEFHATVDDAPNFCDDCPPCTDRQHATVADVNAWRLRVEYSYDAHVDLEGEGYHWASHTSTGTFTLDRVSGPFDGVRSFLGGLAYAFDDLFGGSTDRIPDVGPLLYYRGDGEVTASHREVRVIETEDGFRTVRTWADGTLRQSESAKCEFFRDDNEYELYWMGPGFIDGTRVTTGPGGSQNVSEMLVRIYPGLWAMMQSQGRFTARAHERVREGSMGGVGDLPRWSVPDCRMVQTETIDQTLFGGRGEDASAKRLRGLTTADRGPAVGQATVTWTLTPLTLWNGRVRERPNCSVLQ